MSDDELKDTELSAEAAVKAKFSRELRLRLRQKGWTQVEFVNRVNQLLPEGAKLSKQSMSHFMNRRNLPRGKTQAAIAEVLGVDLTELMSAPEATWRTLEARRLMQKSSPNSDNTIMPLMTIDSVDGQATINIRDMKMDVQKALKILELLKAN